MSLAAGTRLGPYEIVAPLGAGGMGEVYRARDTRLERSVAKLMAVDVSPGAASFERGAPRALFDSKYINYSHPPGGLFHAFAVSRDGQRFLIPRPLSAATYDGLSGVPVAVVINWSAALK